MRVFCMDPHISLIADFKTIFPELEVVDWCLSGHAWVMNRVQDTPKHINVHTWMDLTPERITNFQNEYDSFLKTFDLFIVAYASSFALVYEKYNKPIIMMNATRYDIPYCFTRNSTHIPQYHRCLIRLQHNNLLTIVSNNAVDKLYLGRATGLLSEIIPSLCLYTNVTYTPTKSTFLCTNGEFGNHPLLSYKRDFGGRYQWSDITSFRGIVCLPYEAGFTMSMFEQFTAGCPMFLPTKSFWKTQPNQIQSNNAYWYGNHPEPLKDFNDETFWIEHSNLWDAFASPNTYFFDSIPHLFSLLESFMYVVDTEFRKQYIATHKNRWHEILTSIRTNHHLQ